MHQKAAVSVKQHHRLIWPCDRRTHRKRDPISNCTKFANGQKTMLRAVRHLCEIVGTMSRRIHQLPVLRDHFIKGAHHVAGVMHARLRIKGCAIRGCCLDQLLQCRATPLGGPVFNRLNHGLYPQPCVRTQVQVSGHPPLAERHWIHVNVQQLGIRPQFATVRIMPRQRTSNGDDQVRLTKTVTRRVA